MPRVSIDGNPAPPALAYIRNNIKEGGTGGECNIKSGVLTEYETGAGFLPSTVV